MVDVQRSTYCEEAMARAMDGEVDLFGVVDAALRVVEANGLPDHAGIHELGGRDQLNVGGLAGLLADAQTPLAHAATHQPGGADAMAVDAAVGVGSLRTLGLGALQGAVGTHLHDGQILQHDRVNSNGGVFPFDTTGQVQFSRGIRLANTMDLACAVAYGSDAFSAAAPAGSVWTRYLELNQAAGNTRLVRAYTAGSQRFGWGADNTAETGADAGTNWLMYAYTDAGAFIDTVLQIVRAAGGDFRINRPLRVASTIRADGGFNDNGTPGIDGWADDGVNFRLTFSGGLITAVANSTGGGHS